MVTGPGLSSISQHRISRNQIHILGDFVGKRRVLLQQIEGQTDKAKSVNVLVEGPFWIDNRELIGRKRLTTPLEISDILDNQ